MNWKHLTVAVCLLITQYLYAKEDIVEISVEIVEVDTQKTNEVGIKWTDFVQTQEQGIPSIFRLSDFDRLTNIHADIKLLMNKGAA
jgi:hypothetical protein